jgi:cobalt-zinc-cadmium efflux system membrane fusion protein
MKQRILWASILSLATVLLTAGCGKKEKNEAAAEAPPQATVERAPDGNVLKVDHPEQFPLFTATERQATSTLKATGTVNPDISRQIPVVTLASGRVIDTRVRIGDYVKKGQLLMEVQSNDV